MHLILCNALMVGASVCILTFICITFSPSASASACIVIMPDKDIISYPFSRHVLLHNLKYHRNIAKCMHREFVPIEFLFNHDIFVLIQSTSVKC